MTVPHALAFVAFSAVMAGTPGPSNALLAVVGMHKGVRGGLPSLFGQVGGTSLMMFVVTLGLGSLLLEHPMALEFLKWGGALVLCWFAWRIATAGHRQESADCPVGFMGMTVFQWVNPKAWLACVGAVATFLDRGAGGAPIQAATFATLFLLTALASCFPWLAFGQLLQRSLSSPRARRLCNGAMGALLAASVVLFFLPRF